MLEDLTAVIDALRSSGGDTLGIEVKASAGGLPGTLAATLGSFANHPGGGTIILGLDEANGFRPVRLPDVQVLKQGVAAKARMFTPPVTVNFGDAVVDGHSIVIVEVRECDPALKPCRVTASGRAYVRVYDGDYAMSPQEEQALAMARLAPHHDKDTVDDATVDDLDPDLLGGWMANVRAASNALSRFDDKELLHRAGILDGRGRPCRAAVLALGRHPQQWWPRFVLQAAIIGSRREGPMGRADEPVVLDGPIPLMLDSAMAWARRAFPRRIVDTATGDVRDQFEFPLTAFRELVANALIHRDLSPWSESLAVEVRLLPDRLVVESPGGLYGITVDRLGRDMVSSTRNARLMVLCQNVRTPSGARVVEGLSTGLQQVASLLEQQGLPAPRYMDSGTRFTALLTAKVTLPPAPALGNSTRGRIFTELAAGPLSVTEIVARLGLQPPNVRYHLRGLVTDGTVQQVGGRGRPTVYQRTNGRAD